VNRYKRGLTLTAAVLAVIFLLVACGPTETPEPTVTPSPTEDVADEPTDEPVEEPDAEPTGPITITPPEEPAVCNAVSFSEAFPAREVDVRPEDETDYGKGASVEDAEITIYEYSDFQCPGCASMGPVLAAFLEEHPEVRLVYRHYPLSFHEHAVLAAEATEAAGAQGKFWEMHDLLFERQGEWSPLSEEEARVQMSEYAEELELDIEEFDEALDEELYVEKVESHFAEAQAMGLGGTPSFIYNDLVYPSDQWGLSPQGLDVFAELLVLEEMLYAAPPEQEIDPEGEYQAILKTSQGEVVVDLLPEAAPTFVNNFIFLAREDWYAGTEFFLVQEDYVAVAGDPTNTGMGYPGYRCAGETQSTFDRSGLVGMDPTGLFFITLGTQASQLSGELPLIGQVVEGQEVLDELARVAPSQTPGQPPTEPDMLESVEIVEK
jgi:cyclophilin family peptidyl-prolyl cis-trans isomerase/predicted DsbA family dithiol-disulfide isomerase